MGAEPCATSLLAERGDVALRRIVPADLPTVSRFPFTVSITEPLTELARLTAVFDRTGLWEAESGAVAIVQRSTGRLLGTAQFYPSSPTIHGYELGYILHDAADRSRGFGSPAVALFSDLLFERAVDHERQQLLIEVWNTASWRLAERCGFVREGILRSAGLGEQDPADCLVYSRTRRDWREARLTRVGG